MDKLIFSTLEGLPIIGLLIIIGISLFTLGKGADLLVNQAVNISVKWGIPKMVVGATIVSLGTTIPEVSVSMMSALKGNPDLALGNAVGSIIANTALILGLSSLLGKVSVDMKTIGKQGKILIIASIALAIISLPMFGDGVNGNISKFTGIIFIFLLIVYIVTSIISGKKSSEESNIEIENSNDGLILQLIKLFSGIGIVVISSKVLIPSVEIVATSIGIPQSIIASTLVAFGTSLPELITAITSVKKGYGELAVGNVIGANILNILFVIGLSAAVSKEGLIVPQEFIKIHIPVMLATLFIFILSAINKDEKISRKEGTLLMGIYGMYLFFNYFMI